MSAGLSGESARIESALEVLAELSERRSSDGRLRDAIALVRSALWDEVEDSEPAGQAPVAEDLRGEIGDITEALTHALHSTETAQGWYGAPECEEVGRVLAPHVQALLAQAWQEGAAAGHHSPLTWFALRQCNPYKQATPPASTPSTKEDA